MRRIHEIKSLPVSELTDEEIAKAAMYRLRAKGILLMYMDEDGGAATFYRWKNKQGKWFCDYLRNLWQDKLGKQKHITNKK